MKRTDRNRRLARQLNRRKDRLARRLDPGAFEERTNPVMAGGNLKYDMSGRALGTAVSGVGIVHRLAQKLGLVESINRSVHVIKRHLPYHESDHVLNIAYNHLCGGTCIGDLELRRQDEAYLEALGARRVPDPTTAGDFCDRFEATHIDALMETINRIRLKVWARQPSEFFREAVIDGDGTIAPTLGECKQGMDITFKGDWGYHPLLISLANTKEPLFLLNRPGNRPSHDGAAAYFDKAIALCREAGFRRILLRGDTDFSQTAHLDRWDADGVGFLFGFNAVATLLKQARDLPAYRWKTLERPSRYEVATEARARPENVKLRIVRERGYKHIRLDGELVAEFSYQPVACKKAYRVIVSRKNLSISRGDTLLEEEFRDFFYITNDTTTSAAELVLRANQRCDQENLIDQLKNGVRAMRMPTNTLLGNWAYMVMASLAWTLKAWFALLLPETGRWAERYKADKVDVLQMEFKRFFNGFIQLPAQLVKGARRTVMRVLGWNPYLPVFFRGVRVIESLRS